MVETDQGTAQGQEGLMDIEATFVPNRQPPVAIEPRQGALDHPAVPTQARAGVDAFAGDAHLDMSTVQEPPATGEIVGLVGMELAWSFAPVSRTASGIP
jgi:hypothetical protein